MSRPRIYYPGCRVCQYMRNNPEFRKQVLDSSYFNPQANESLTAVVKRWGNPMTMPAIYSHMTRHQKASKPIEALIPATAIPVVELEAEVTSDTAHERALDEVITKGRDMVRSGEIKITAQTLIQAVRTKAEIEKSTKDRRLDVLKMMAGAFAGNEPTGKDREGTD